MYKFPLATVLNHRKTLEDFRQKELGHLKNQLAEEMKKFTNLNNARDFISKQLKNKQKKKITAGESILYFNYIQQLTKNLDTQKKKLLKIEIEICRKREELVSAMKSRKVLESLKEKGLENYNKSEIKKEQDFMNEMASVRFKSKDKE